MATELLGATQLRYGLNLTTCPEQRAWILEAMVKCTHMVQALLLLPLHHELAADNLITDTQ